MADQYSSDPDLDEHGIYRGHEAQPLSGLDEDGILLDDEDRLRMFRLRRADSGIGTAERGRTRDSGAQQTRESPALFDQYTEDSFPMDERSLNITDLEDSDPRSGRSSPGNRRSVDSLKSFESDEDDDGDLRQRRRRRRHRTSQGPDPQETTSDSEEAPRRRYSPRYQRFLEQTGQHSFSTRGHPREGFREQQDSHDGLEQDPISGQVQSNSLDYFPHNHGSREELEQYSEEEECDAPYDGTERDVDLVSVDVARENSLNQFEALEAAAAASREEEDLLNAYLQDLTDQDNAEHDDENVIPTANKFEHSDHDLEDRGWTETGSDGYGAGYAREDREHGNSSPCEADTLSDGDDGRGRSPSASYITEDTRSATHRTKEFSESKPTKIPYLRSRSPSMSRPGTTGRISRPSSRADTLSADEDRSRPRGENCGHSLPLSVDKRHYSSGVRSDSESRSRNSSPESSEGFTVPVNSDVALRSENLNDYDAEVASFTIGVRNETNRNKPRPASTGTNVRGTLPKEAKTNHRPSSAKQRRQFSAMGSDTPKSFRVRSQSATNLVSSKQPLKASHTVTGSVSEIQDSTPQDQLNRETLVQLQEDYTNLLKKYAEAENTIDSLRIGARIPITLEVSGGDAGAAAAGGGDADRRTSLASLRGGLPLGALGSRPVSRASSGAPLTEPTPAGPGELRLADGRASAPPPDVATDELDPVAAEGAKLSLLVKAKGVEEQMSALQILLDEEHLSVEDQQKALSNIKPNYESLQGEYRQAKEKHELLRRQGKLDPNVELVFDDDKTVEGELYRLGMKLDDLEHIVQNNVKISSQPRKPFQASLTKSPSHGVGVGVGVGVSSAADGDGSIHGGIDEKIRELDRQYTELMSSYKALKQMRRTPERDQEIERCLQELRNIHEEMPQLRKPPLPPELEHRVNSFAADGPVSERKDVMRPLSWRNLNPRESGTKARANPDDRVSCGRPISHRDRKPVERSKGSMSSFDSGVSDSTRRGKYVRPGRAADREDKDSGYVGSEASRNLVPGLRHTTPGSHARTASRNDGDVALVDDSDTTTTESDDRSTVEFVKPYRPPAAARKKSGEHSAGHVQLTGDDRRRKTSARSREQLSDSDGSSYTSGGSRNRRSGLLAFMRKQSDLILKLQKEVGALKKDLKNQTPGAPSAGTTARGTGSPYVGMHPNQPPVGGYYYYPPPQGFYPAPRDYDRSGVEWHGAGPTGNEPEDEVDGGFPGPPDHTVRGHQHYSRVSGATSPFASPYTTPKVPHWQSTVSDVADAKRYQSGNPRDKGHHRDTRTREQGRHTSPHRMSDLRRYYIPSKSQARSPTRSSRRNDHERNRVGNSFDGVYGNSPVRSGHNRRRSRDRRRTGGYPSPVRAFPVGAPPPPPAYGSSDHQRAYPIYVEQNAHAHEWTSPGMYPGYVLSSAQVRSSRAPAAVHRSQSPPLESTPVSQNSLGGQPVVPVQIVPVSASVPGSPGPTPSSKVRYYVREYGAESDVDWAAASKPLRRSQSLPRSVGRVRSRSRQQRNSSDVEYESDVADDLDSSITSALKTAAQLKRMSSRMKASLQDELSRSVRDPSSPAASFTRYLD